MRQKIFIRAILLSAELSVFSEQTLLFGKSVQIVNDEEIAAPTSRPHCKDFADVAFTVEQKKDIDTDFKFSLKCPPFCEKPLFRYDSSGPSHRNSNFQIPINEQKVPTPHFHKYWSDGKEIAYKTEALKDEVQRKALEDISICIYHFMQEANIEYENFQLNSSPGILPFDKEAENSDPLENITFKE